MRRVRYVHVGTPTYAELLLAHLREHGEAYVSQLVRELDLSIGHASLTLRRLERVDLVTHEVRSIGARGGVRHYYRALPTATWSPPTDDVPITEEDPR